MLGDLIDNDLGPTELWPDDCKLFQPYEIEQILLPERACSRSVQAFLKMCSLPFETVERENAEQMSPSGELPFIKSGQLVIAGFEPIVAYINSKGPNLSGHLESTEKSDMTAYMLLVNNALYSAELYISWCHEETLKEVTYPRYGFAYPWPLNHVLCWMKRRSVIKKLYAIEWDKKTLDEVLNEVESCCQALAERLENRPYFFGDRPTELDALVFGHLSAILYTPLPCNQLGIIVRENEKLVQYCNRIVKTYFKQNQVS